MMRLGIRYWWAQNRVVLVVLFCLFNGSSAHATENLVISFMISSGSQRTFWEAEVIKKFKDANPDIAVTQIVRAQDEYKSNFIHMLQTEPVDVAFWFAGERLNQVVNQGLVRPLDDPLLRAGIAKGFVDSTISATSIKGSTYGLPLSYYGWGFYYRKSLFSRLGLKPPTRWADFLEVGRALQVAGIAPTAVGAVEGWPAAAWFDYLNLRINGIEFHRKLLSGEVRFTDAKVRVVLMQWKHLLDLGFFLKETLDKPWDAPLPLLYRNKVGMVLMGGFASAKFPPQMADDIGFFPFPTLVANVPMAEDSPLDVLVLPKIGKNPDAATRFLLFLTNSSALNVYNAKVNQLSPLRSFRASSSNAGEVQALQSAKAISFYFDRDAKPHLVAPAFAAFKQFMIFPFDVDKAILALDASSHGDPLRPKP